MSLFDPFIVAEDLAAILVEPAPDSEEGSLGDRHQRLIEAGMLNCCPDGDFVSLMPSVERADLPWSDGKAWLRRVLGF
jgi:hypothetical protein